MKNNILEINSLAKEVIKLKKLKKNIVLCHGVFDLIHIGHIKYFRSAKKFGDILIVTITADKFINKGNDRPYFNEKTRLDLLSSIKEIDYVSIIYSETAEDSIKSIKPNYYVKGNDYKNLKDDLSKNIYKEKKLVEKFNGKIVFTNDEMFSSSNLLTRYFLNYTKEQIDYINKIKKNYKIQDIVDFFNQMSNKKIAIIGEAIIDSYVSNEVLGKAGKDPILVLKKKNTKKYLGGVLAISKHLASFCKKIDIYSCLGEKSEEKIFIKNNLDKNISLKHINKKNSKTINKTRYLDDDEKNKIIGIYDLDDRPLSITEEKKYLNLIKNIKSYDLVIIADYGHGLLSNKIINYIIKNSKFLSVNTQMNSANLGFHTISKYPTCNYVCMHEGELRHDFRSIDRNILDLVGELKKRVKAQILTITQGSKGSISSDGKNIIKCPAFAKEVYDKIGAGDTLFGISSLCYSVNMKADLASFIGNVAANTVLSSLGNSSILSKQQLIKGVQTLIK